jgi:hypothetical protein
MLKDRQDSKRGIGRCTGDLGRQDDAATMASHVAALGDIICVQSRFLRPEYALAQPLRGLGAMETLNAESEGRQSDDISDERTTLECWVSVEALLRSRRLDERASTHENSTGGRLSSATRERPCPLPTANTLRIFSDSRCKHEYTYVWLMPRVVEEEIGGTPVGLIVFYDGRLAVLPRLRSASQSKAIAICIVYCGGASPTKLGAYG